MFSLEFQPRRESRNLKRERTMALVKRHICDRGSTESQSKFVFVGDNRTELYCYNSITSEDRSLRSNVPLKLEVKWYNYLQET